MNLKLVAAGVFGLGALVGWAVTADHYVCKLEEAKQAAKDYEYLLRKSEDEVYDLKIELRDAKEGHHVREDAKVEEADSAVIAPIVPETPVETEDELIEGVDRETVKTNLQALIDSYTADEDAVDDFVDNAVKTFKKDNTPPFVISRDLFAWDEDEGDDYSKITLTYYPRHRVLLDDQDEVIEDVANVVGWKNLNRFGGESGDPDTVFVRNRRLLTDFEVNKEDDENPPLHVRYGMNKAEFEANSKAGFIKFRPEDE